MTIVLKELQSNKTLIHCHALTNSRAFLSTILLTFIDIHALPHHLL